MPTGWNDGFEGHREFYIKKEFSWDWKGVLGEGNTIAKVQISSGILTRMTS